MKKTFINTNSAQWRPRDYRPISLKGLKMPLQFFYVGWGINPEHLHPISVFCYDDVSDFWLKPQHDKVWIPNESFDWWLDIPGVSDQQYT